MSRVLGRPHMGQGVPGSSTRASFRILLLMRQAVTLCGIHSGSLLFLFVAFFLFEGGGGGGGAEDTEHNREVF